MKSLSLQMRLTLVTVLLISALAMVLTLTNMYNARTIFYDTEPTTYVAANSETAVSDVAYASEHVNEFNHRGGILMVGVITAGGILAYFVLGAGLRPIKDLERQISGINENNLTVRITDFHAGDELDNLAESFNGMLERIECAFETRQRFVSAAAHELKTPLTTVKTNLEVLRIAEEPGKEKFREVFHIVEKQNERMIHLVEDLFAMSRQAEYSFEDTVELGALFTEIIGEQQTKAGEMEVEILLAGSMPVTLRGNGAMLCRAMGNLVENAVKYNRAGGKVLIDIGYQNGSALITVSDTGIGIPAEHREHIFEAFYRVENSRSRKTAGSGLGLAIVKETIIRHGGTIDVYPTAGGGSSFVVRLPILT